MTLNQIASKIAKLEGKKSQARIGDIREILKIMVDNHASVLRYEDSFVNSLVDLGYDKWQKKHSDKQAKAKKK